MDSTAAGNGNQHSLYTVRGGSDVRKCGGALTIRNNIKMHRSQVRIAFRRSCWSIRQPSVQYAPHTWGLVRGVISWKAVPGVSSTISFPSPQICRTRKVGESTYQN